MGQEILHNDGGGQLHSLLSLHFAHHGANDCPNRKGVFTGLDKVPILVFPMTFHIFFAGFQSWHEAGPVLQPAHERILLGEWNYDLDQWERRTGLNRIDQDHSSLILFSLGDQVLQRRGQQVGFRGSAQLQRFELVFLVLFFSNHPRAIDRHWSSGKTGPPWCSINVNVIAISGLDHVLGPANHQGKLFHPLRRARNGLQLCRPPGGVLQIHPLYCDRHSVCLHFLLLLQPALALCPRQVQ